MTILKRACCDYFERADISLHLFEKSVMHCHAVRSCKFMSAQSELNCVGPTNAYILCSMVISEIVQSNTVEAHASGMP